MEDCYLQFIMHQTSEVPFHVPFHNHNCSELVYYISGEGKSTIGGVEYGYVPGTFALIEPKAVHDETAITTTKLIYIGFLYNTEKHSFTSGLYKDFNGGEVLRGLQELSAEWGKKLPFYSIKLNNIMQSLLISIFRQYHAEQFDKTTHFASYVKQYIDEHANEPIDLHGLAEMSGYSYDWLRHLFKEQTGQSLSRYILNRRLQNAMFLLQCTDKSVTDIAAECQFSSTSHFITYFKRYNGMTPAKFRGDSRAKDKVQWSYDV